MFCLESHGCHLVLIPYLLSFCWQVLLLCLVILVLMVHSDCFQKVVQRFFPFKDRLFCMALFEQLDDGRWYMQLADIWHWYLLRCIFVSVVCIVTGLKNIFL